MEKYKVSVCKTKNKFILKFEINHFITNHENYEFNNIDETSNSQLAKELFYLPFVKKIYIACYICNFDFRLNFFQIFYRRNIYSFFFMC